MHKNLQTNANDKENEIEKESKNEFTFTGAWMGFWAYLLCIAMVKYFL